MSIIIAKQPQPYFADASAEKELIGPFFFVFAIGRHTTQLQNSARTQFFSNSQ